MNYEELLQQLNDLKDIGCDLSKIHVLFETRKGTKHEINFVKLRANTYNHAERHIKLSKFNK